MFIIQKCKYIVFKSLDPTSIQICHSSFVFCLAVFHCLVYSDLATLTGPAVIPALPTFPVTRFHTPTLPPAHLFPIPSLAPHIAARFHSASSSIVPSQMYHSCLLVLTCLPASCFDLHVFGRCLFAWCSCLLVTDHS